MQFKHPEILYVLFALLIPVFIHLFQLQRFTNTAFTNIKFLKEIEFQTRRSSRLKKWLVLISRLGIFAALIIAFAQPFSSKKDTSKDWLTTIYLDNSTSMQAKGKRGELFKRAIQDIAEYLPDKGHFSLLTNDQLYPDLSKKLLLEQLKNTTYSPTTTALKTVLLRTQQIFEKNKTKNNKLILISDFQLEKNNSITNDENYFKGTQELDFVQVLPKTAFNIGIDSAYVVEKNADNTLLEILLTNEGATQKNISVSALHNDIVLAKNTLDFSANELQKTRLLIPNKMDNISIQLNIEDAYLFDNTYFISFQQQKLIKVLEIGENNSFLEKLYTKDEFNFIKKSPNEVSFELIDKQEFVLVNNLEKLPQQLAEKLLSFVKKGGSLTIIPHRNNSLNDLNSFFNQLNIGKIVNKHSDSLLVTKIHFSHPILQRVFDKKITNFQYPSVTTHYESVLFNEQRILSFENQQAFISQIPKGEGDIFWVAAPLDIKSSNFTKAPLIVPIFYRMAKMSVNHTDLTYRIGSKNKIVVDFTLEQDQVLQIVGNGNSFIPRQEIQAENVVLYTEKHPQTTGFYKILNKDNPIRNLAFNYPINENSLSFLQVSNFEKENTNLHQFSTIKKALESLTVEQNVASYFKWFVLLAFIFLLIEILLLKYL